MKVLWLGHFVPWPLRGGSVLRSFHLLKEASLAGEVSYVGFYQKALQPTADDLRDARSALEAICRHVRILPIPAERGPFTRQRLLLRGLVGKCYDEAWLTSGELNAVLVNETEKSRPDLIHVDTVGLAPYTARVHPLPFVLNHHNIESQMMVRRAEQSGNLVNRFVLSWQARLLRQFERRWVPRARRNLVVSELDGARLKDIVPGAVVDVVPNGVDTDYFKALRHAAIIVPRSLIFVGGLNWYPNLSAMLWFIREIFPLVRQRYPDATLTVIGRCPANLDSTFGTIPGVHFPGEVPDIRPLVSASAVYVCPMLEGGGTRLKVLDALAQGIPLVATRMAVEGIPVQHGRDALLADGASAFADAVCSLFERPAASEEMTLAGRKLVESEFAWSSVGERLRAAYHSCLTTREPAPCAGS